MINAPPRNRSAFFAAFTFYCLVAFEFFYMATSFAVYFYGVYGPGLEWISDLGPLNWIVRFFMPHIARETSSPLITYHEYAGMALFLGGLAVFAIGVVQVYLGKLRKQQEVSGLLYRYIRHPQYLALMVSGLGMVIVWPRYLVLIAFVILAFAYVLLAKTEEKICLDKFPGYAAYLNKTGMFLPRAIEAPFKFMSGKSSGVMRFFKWLAAFAIVMSASIGAAFANNAHAIGSLYGVFENDIAVVSVGYAPETKLKDAMTKVLDNETVKQKLAAFQPINGSKLKLIGYILPTDYFVSEIPMQLPAGKYFGHEWPDAEKATSFKVILAEANIAQGQEAKGRDILKLATNKVPIAEIHIDLTTMTVMQVLEPPQTAFYRGMPVPLY